MLLLLITKLVLNIKVSNIIKVKLFLRNFSKNLTYLKNQKKKKKICKKNY